jgi:hypothetical protein
MAITGAEYAAAVVHNGHGRYGRAFAAAQRAAQHEEPGVASWVLPELIEAAVRSGRTDVAAAALERFSQSTQASGTDWALGMEAQSRALLSEGRDAEGGYRDAIDRLGRSRIQVQLARSRLLYGEWLRRERRRVDAREQLRIAYEMFATMGAEGFAARAAHELLATGEEARKRTVETSDQLTAQETQIATLARDGLSNPEIAAQLFISPDPSGVANLGVTEIVDHYDTIIRKLDQPPIIMGHSFGGLFTQILLDRGLGAAGVAIDPPRSRASWCCPSPPSKSGSPPCATRPTCIAPWP